MKKLSLKNILVPIDFSERSVQAIPTARLLAQQFGGNVHLANICETYYPYAFLTPAAPLPAYPVIQLQDTRKAVEKRLKELAKQKGLGGKCYTTIGSPVFSEICSLSQEIAADLIVTSTHGRMGLRHVFMGSTAERLVQHSPCPVLVVREPKRGRSAGRDLAFDTILVPVDFSPCSLAGLSYAVQFADRVGARIVVLHVVDLGMAVTADGYAMYDFAEMEDAKRKEAEEQMANFVRWVKFGRVSFTTLVKVNPALPTICEIVKEQKIDLVITSTHGRTGLSHIMLGSTAEQIVRHAACPVLVVPSHPQARIKQLSTPASQLRQKANRSIAGVRLPAGAWSKTQGRPQRAERNGRSLPGRHGGSQLRTSGRSRVAGARVRGPK